MFLFPSLVLYTYILLFYPYSYFYFNIIVSPYELVWQPFCARFACLMAATPTHRISALLISVARRQMPPSISCFFRRFSSKSGNPLIIIRPTDTPSFIWCQSLCIRMKYNAAVPYLPRCG